MYSSAVATLLSRKKQQCDDTEGQGYFKSYPAIIKAQHPKEVLTRFWANNKIKDFKTYCISNRFEIFFGNVN